jgi:hypothetical protein
VLGFSTSAGEHINEIAENNTINTLKVIIVSVLAKGETK